ncbi:class I adenylate-forming enzyme family protein [Halosolutus halophilus]|uniref:class I adenylate-forming enzyme family protein n=1 Tax=Halosolutus halophilus TaxID=1552990 RepID=UPI002234F747|nr:class I adenylate-forming enzyme family protein [Halosolutus halophilus]
MTANFDLGIDGTARFVDRSAQFSVADQLRKTARTDPDRQAIVDLKRERSVTYAELDERTDRLASSLLDLGVEFEVGSVAIVAENRLETIELAHACAKVGALLAPLNWRLERDELVHCADLIEPDILVVSDRFREKVDWIVEDGVADPLIVDYDSDDESGGVAESDRDDDRSFELLRENGDPDEARLERIVDPEQGFAVINTSGTTGLPKGAVVSHRAELARSNQVAQDFGLERGDNYVGWGPIFHMGGLDWIVTMAALGGTYYVVDGFEPEAILDSLTDSERPIAWLFLVPGMIEPLCDHIEDTDLDATDLPPIRTMGALADILDPALVARVTTLFDTPFQNTYGSTEAGHATSGNQLPIGVEPDDELLRKRESPNCAIDLDIDGYGGDNRGEMLVRGPSLFSGYLDNSEANREAFEDGWYHTGDVFERHDDGTYSYLNRTKYLIKSGGENIYPAELEEVLESHDRVAKAVVVKTDDPTWGEVPRALVGVEDTLDGDEDRDTLRKELLGLCEGRLARYKLPHYIEFVDPDRFPISGTGKVARPEIEEWPRSEDARVRGE